MCYSFGSSPMPTLSFLGGVVGKQGDLASRKRFNCHGSINDLIIVDRQAYVSGRIKEQIDGYFPPGDTAGVQR